MWLFLQILLALLPAHDFHVSKCLIAYSASDQALQISLHLFIDDLEAALIKGGAPADLRLCTRAEHEEAETYLQRYLGRHFRLTVNGAAIRPEFLGKEISDDLQAVWCYLEAPVTADLRSLGLTNSLLLDVFDDQKNLVRVEGPGGQSGLLVFERGRTADSIDF